MGSLAALQTATGGKVMVMEGDAEIVEAGGKGDYLFGDTPSFPAMKVARVLRTVHRDPGRHHAESRATPGHTGAAPPGHHDRRGGRTLLVVFAGSMA